MVKVFSVEGVTNPVSQLLLGQGAVGFENASFGVRPFGFDVVEPKAFDRQKATEQTHALTGTLDSAIMGAYPSANRGAGVPTGIIPKHDQH